MMLDLFEVVLSTISAALAQPEPALGFALSRAVLGLVIAIDGLRMLREHDLWYGASALRPVAADVRLPVALDLFAWAERLGGSSRNVLHGLVISALLFAAGIETKVSGAILLVALIAVPLRNTWIVYGGDSFGRTILLLLLFSPCDASLSVDRWLADGSLGLGAQAPPWGGRLVQVEVVVLYLSNFLCKVPASAWRRGQVMFDLLRNRNFAAADVPKFFKHRTVARLMTWGALAAELAFAPALLFDSTATVACVAAIIFHLTIARLIDVHLFSAIMVAALLACLPRSLLLGLAPKTMQTTPPASLDLGDGLALALALTYVIYIILWELPGQGRWLQRIRAGLAPVFERIGWGRGWRLFTTSAPQAIEIEFTTVDARGRLSRWTWERPENLLLRARQAPSTRPGHRFQRFKFSLLRDQQARQRLVERFRDELWVAGIGVRAWSIDALYMDVQTEGAIVGGLNIGAQVASTSNTRLDRNAAVRLGRAVRCGQTRRKLAALVQLFDSSSSEDKGRIR